MGTQAEASEQRSAAISTGLVCILGITEPALYGIALPEKKPLYAAMQAVPLPVPAPC